MLLSCWDTVFLHDEDAVPYVTDLLRHLCQPLRADTTDMTKTDKENSSLCRPFLRHIVSKINDLKFSISATLSDNSTPSFFTSSPFRSVVKNWAL